MQGEFRLGEYRVRPSLNQIEGRGEKRTVEPKAMDVLVYLAQKAGEVLNKEQIIRAVWPDLFVTDEVLTNCIFQLRKAFEDDAKQPSYIQTVPRRGYRLIAEVHFSVFEPVPVLASAVQHTVGRERELAQLRTGLENVSSGPGLLLAVAGEPGIGKTTLVEQFLDEIVSGRSDTTQASNTDALDHLSGLGCAVAKGQCSERLAGTEAYVPFLDVLESLLQQDGNGTGVAMLMRERAPCWYTQVATLSGDDPVEGRVLKEAQNATQERIKRDLAAFLQEVSRARPLVMIFEDLHWAVSAGQKVGHFCRFKNVPVPREDTRQPPPVRTGRGQGRVKSCASHQFLPACAVNGSVNSGTRTVCPVLLGRSHHQVSSVCASASVQDRCVIHWGFLEFRGPVETLSAAVFNQKDDTGTAFSPVGKG